MNFLLSLGMQFGHALERRRFDLGFYPQDTGANHHRPNVTNSGHSAGNSGNYNVVSLSAAPAIQGLPELCAETCPTEIIRLYLIIAQMRALLLGSPEPSNQRVRHCSDCIFC